MLSINQKQYTSPDYRNYDVNVINNELLNINWDGVYNSYSPNQSLNVMKPILKDTRSSICNQACKGKEMTLDVKRNQASYEHT